MIYIKKLILFLCLFFLFDTLVIDSNSDKRLIYNSDNMYLEDDFNLYLNGVKSKELYETINNLDIKVLSYSIDGHKYYARNKDDLDEQFLKDKSLEEKLFYESNDYYIDSIHILCEIYKLNILNTKYSIY